MKDIKGIQTKFTAPSTENGHNWLIRTTVGDSVVETKCKSLYNTQKHYLVKMRGHMNKVFKELTKVESSG